MPSPSQSGSPPDLQPSATREHHSRCGSRERLTTGQAGWSRVPTAIRIGGMLLLAATTACPFAGGATAQETAGAGPADAAEIDFARQVLPVLSDKCFVCHGPDTRKRDQVRLDTFEFATADLGGYRAVNPEQPEHSELLVRIHDEEDPMPPADAEKQLTPAEREILSRWIREGGRYETHWAFVPPRRPEVPTVAGNAGESGAIDAFLAARLAEAGVDFASEADRATLARRVSLVLTGLPPDPDQLDAFLADHAPDAYGRFVDALLASPGFGEHQARAWLDAVRYGDTHGLHLDNRRGIYPYRDWVVRAFNRNLPLDDFITWQLAGDLLPEPTLEQRTATGFVRLNPSTSEGGAIPEEFQAKNNFDRTETLGTVLLGMTLSCARCHTHKYDPIPHVEYFRLMAFFNSTADSALDGNSYTYEPFLTVPVDQAAWDEWEAMEQERDALLSRIDATLAPTGGAIPDDGSPVDRLRAAADPSGPLAAHELRTNAEDLARRMTEAEERFTTTLVARDLDQPRPTRLLERGEYDLPTGEPLLPGVPTAMGAFPDDAPRNRLGLAQWLTAPDQPLTARVLVNRIWQGVFGAGLVRTPEDFGLQGEQPTHPELLDWLAVELQESGWNLKHMLRLMTESRAFRQSSAWRPEIDDPANRLFARGPSHRLDAEVLRDMGLWASGLLDPHMGGEGVKPYQPAGLWEAMAHPASNTKEYVQDSGSRLYRRSLYVYWKRTSPHPMMILFDAPDRESSCVRRSRTNSALQSLALLNETQRLEMARTLAERLVREGGDEASTRLDLLFRLLASRPPLEAERAACLGLLESMLARFEKSPEDALALLSSGDAPRDESLDPAEHAAWTQVAATVLASDAAILLY